MRALNLLGQGANWSVPEVININDVPPPASVDVDLQRLTPVQAPSEEDDGLTFRLEMEVSWMTSSPPARIQRRQAVLDAQMDIANFMMIFGPEEVDGPFASVPESSKQRMIPVKYRCSNTLSDMYTMFLLFETILQEAADVS